MGALQGLGRGHAGLDLLRQIDLLPGVEQRHPPDLVQVLANGVRGQRARRAGGGGPGGLRLHLGHASSPSWVVSPYRAPGRVRHLLEVVLQLAGAGRVPKLAQRLRLDLSDPLPGDTELPADLLERARVAVYQTES